MYLHSGLVQIISPLLGWIKLYKLNSNVLHFHLIVSPFVFLVKHIVWVRWDHCVQLELVSCRSWCQSRPVSDPPEEPGRTALKRSAWLQFVTSLQASFFFLLFLQKKRIDSGHALLGNARAPRLLPSQFYPSITLRSSNEPHSEGLFVL